METKQKILAVDDEAINLQIISSVLEKDWDVTVATDGGQAMEKLKKVCPDLILLDVMMPGLNGYDLCRLIKAEPSFAQVPIIFLTALTSTEAEAEALDAGGTDFISKPFDLRVLKLRVRNTLELKRQADLILAQRDELSQRYRKLEEAMARIKRLEGILPICMYCKSIRSESDCWEQIESYITDHTDAMFSHGICPACKAEQFPDI